MSKISMKLKLGFGIGDLGGNLFFTFIGFYLMYFLTDVLGLSAALAGTTLMIGKIWDAVTDPVTGFASDRTISRWGRRRPYIFTGAILSFFAMYLLFSISPRHSQAELFILSTLYFCLLNTAYTLVNIPYTALIPELTRDYDQRTLLVAYRMSFAVLGTFVGAAAVMPLVNSFQNEQTGWAIMASILGGVMMGTALITVWAVREPQHTKEDVKGHGFLKTYLEALKLRVFLLILIPWTLFITGISMIQGALVYYFKYIFLSEDSFQLALVALLSTSLLFIPIWAWLSHKISKKTCYNIGMLIVTTAVLVFSFSGTYWPVSVAILIMGFAGVGLSTHYIMPHSILPDVVEYDAIENNGLRREGVFSGLWTFSSKLGQAFALALNGWILSLFHYKPDVLQTPETQLGIKLICGPFPALFIIMGVLILVKFPITRDFYDRMIRTGSTDF
ncbi:MFS transporter [Oceanispirochaeta sp.]|jgi:GPH family glycoside/pentoside/hexuronide:cation symporter|uniref:MFS transporter n=1 Tax=Oceanispirochaeta sp. TaxID=2035350 RepID=UPI002605F313|nr:MFS transporter [Oceanispirochaeta sp.]MDA3956971.1 MFS transporter [Oceanispirochaeta sp.]